MQKHTFPLTEEYIELMSLLKYLGLAQTGGHAKMLVDEGLVVVNGQTESRRRYKCRKGDVIVVNGEVEILVG